MWEMFAAGILLYWVLAYQKSTEALVMKSGLDARKYQVPIIENMEHYGTSSEIVNRFNDDLKEDVQEHEGQFGIKEFFKADTNGSVTRTFSRMNNF